MTTSVPTLADLLETGVEGRTVLVRSDLNVPLDGGKITDVLSNAPKSADGFFVVPKVVE